MYILYVNGWEEFKTKSFYKMKKLVHGLRSCTNFSGEPLHIKIMLGDVTIFIATGGYVEYKEDPSCNFYE